MAQAYPRLGCDNLLYENRNDLAATTTDTGYDVANLADWTPGTYWKPTFVSNPPATEYVYCYPLTETNKIRVSNWYFRDWSDGASSAPDGWTLTGAGASIARTASFNKIHDYGALITRAGTDCYLSQDVSGYEAYKGREVTLGAWALTSIASRARVTVDCGSSSSSSSYHTGGGSWEWLSVTIEVPYDATQIQLRLECKNGNTSPSFDGVALYLGDTAAQTPHAHEVDYLAAIDHNLDTAGLTLSLEYTTDTDPSPASSWSTHLTLSTSNDKAGWIDTDTSQTRAAWRLKLTPATGSQAAALACVAFGTFLQLPELLGDGFNPYDRTLAARTPLTKSGTPIQRALRRVPRELDITVPPGTAEADLTGTWSTFTAHAIDAGLPFFFQWDDGDHGSDTFLSWLADGARFRAPLTTGYQASRLSVSKWMAVDE